jgi:hypothetical protein
MKKQIDKGGVKMNKTNGWKIASIVLLFVVLGLLILNIINEKKENQIDINGFKIQESQYKEMENLAIKNGWDNFIIVDIKNNKSVSLYSTGIK